MLDRTIGLPAGVANGNSGHGAHFKLRALRELVLVRRPCPSILEEIRDDARHFAQVHRHFLNMRKVLLFRHIFKLVDHGEDDT